MYGYKIVSYLCVPLIHHESSRVYLLNIRALMLLYQLNPEEGTHILLKQALYYHITPTYFNPQRAFLRVYG